MPTALRAASDDPTPWYLYGVMSVSKRLQQAADRFLSGDGSISTAQALEGVLIEEHLGEDRAEELLYVRRLVLSTLEDLA